MKKRLCLMFALLVTLLQFGFVAPRPVSAGTDVFQNACDAKGADDSTVCNDAKNKANPITGKNGILYKASIIIAMITGSVAVIMMIAGGFMIVTSGGDSSKVASGRRAIIYAAVGLVVIAMAQTIVIFVINSI